MCIVMTTCRFVSSWRPWRLGGLIVPLSPALVCREVAGAAGYHGGLFQHARLDCLAPDAVVRRGGMVLEGIFVAIDFVEEEMVRGGVVFDHIEAQACRLIVARAA